MAYQFAHLEVYSRKADKTGVNTDFVFGEVQRHDGFCNHVDHPEEPKLVYGMSVDDLKKLHDERASSAKTTNAKGQTRSIRKDQKTLATVILSHPGEEENQDVASVAEWQRRSIQWLRNKYGDDLKTVVRHNDESYPHLHAYILPSDSEMKASALHPGMSAKSAIVQRGASIEENRMGDKAYRQAMREWQDDYYENVGLACGLTRIGPGRRRLSKAAHNAEKAQSLRARAVMNSVDAVEKRCNEMKESAKANTDIARQMLDDAKKALADADAVKKDADDKAKMIKDDAEKKAKSIIAKAKRQAREIIEKAQKPAEIVRNAWAKLTGKTERQKIGFAIDKGRAEGRAERQKEIDIANAKTERIEKERDRVIKDLKHEKEERANDFVLPKREHAEYAKWKMEQRTKNAPANGLERSNLRGYGYAK